MFLSGKGFYFNLTTLFGLITSILCDCQVNIVEDSTIRPNYYKNIGTHKLKLNTYNGKILLIREMQEIQAECDTKFELPMSYNTYNTIYLKCKENYLYIASDRHHKRNSDYFRGSVNLQCSRLPSRLVESNVNFDWCPSNVTSYILSQPYNVGGICYDIFNSSFYSVYYRLSPNKIENVQTPLLDDMYSPGVEIEFITETFGVNSLKQYAFENPDFDIWINEAKYKFNSMIQHDKLHHFFNDKYATLLEFLWYPNLRFYNWKYYINALEDHVEKDHKTYDILAGVSGAIKLPLRSYCNKSHTMKEVVFDRNRRIPLYVWNYLQDRDNSGNDLVIIGYNSPFYEVHSKDDIVFCPDRCGEIDWLKDVRSSFHFSTMGIVFCCSVEDVRFSSRLYGFPKNDIKPQAVELVTRMSNIIHDATTDINDEEMDE